MVTKQFLDNDVPRHVTQLQGSHGAFAALRGDGQVLCWGDALCGGEMPTAAAERLRQLWKGDAVGFQATTWDDLRMT